MILEYEYPKAELEFFGWKRTVLNTIAHATQIAIRDHIRSVVVHINGRSVGGVVFEETP